MECLGPEQLVVYVRGGGGDPRAVEDHVRDCPACAMELLLVRETLGETKAKAGRPGTDRLRAVPPKRSVPWIPWAVAAGLLVAALVFAVASQRGTPPAPVVVRPVEPVRPKPPVPPAPDVPKAPGPVPKPPPVPEPPKPAPEVRPEPRPEKAPEPVKPTPPPPPPAKPEPEPSKPAPTLVEKTIVARVLRSLGPSAAPVGRTYRAGETVATARQEYLEVALEGYGRVYVRENSQAELGAPGEIALHEGELLARMEPGRKLSSLKLPVAQVEPLAAMFSVLATKTSAEISILDGRVGTAKGPATLVLKAGKAPEVRALDAGFASWLPDKLAAKKFTGWYEAEEFPSLQGFRVQGGEAASGGKAVFQVAEQGGIGMKTGLPFKGRHVVWVRIRQYEAKPVMIGFHLNGQPGAEVKLEGVEGKPWRWVGPLVVTSDRLELGVTALSRWPLKEGDERRSFPVVVDAVVVSSDPKYVPPERLPEEGRGLELIVDEPAGK